MRRVASASQLDAIHVQREIETLLQFPGAKRKPVVFLQETKGMLDAEECRLHWQDKDCKAGYCKEFFSQTWHFTDGACLAVPPGCKDVYYFPVNNATGTCSVDSLDPGYDFPCRDFAKYIQALDKPNVLLPS